LAALYVVVSDNSLAIIFTTLHQCLSKQQHMTDHRKPATIRITQCQKATSEHNNHSVDEPTTNATITRADEAITQQ